MNTRRTSLTPTVITDRNGKVTTVHKKPQSVASVKRIPAPEVVQPSSLERIFALMDRQGVDVTPQHRASIIKLHALLADPDTHEAAIRWQGRISRWDSGQTDVIISALESKEGFLAVLTEMETGYSSGQMSGMAAVYEPDLFVPPLLADEPEEVRVALTLKRYSAGYHLLRQGTLLGLEHESYGDVSKLSAGKVDTVRSFYRLVSALHDVRRSSTPTKDLMEFALYGSHGINDVVSVIRETGSDDPVLIRGVLEGVAAPVAEGWL